MTELSLEEDIKLLLKVAEIRYSKLFHKKHVKKIFRVLNYYLSLALPLDKISISGEGAYVAYDSTLEKIENKLDL